MKMQLKWGFASMLAASTLLAATTTMAAVAAPPTVGNATFSVVQSGTVTPVSPKITLNGSTLTPASVVFGKSLGGTATCTNTATAVSCTYTNTKPTLKTDRFTVRVSYSYVNSRGKIVTGTKSATVTITITKPPVSR